MASLFEFFAEKLLPLRANFLGFVKLPGFYEPIKTVGHRPLPVTRKVTSKYFNSAIIAVVLRYDV